MKVMETDAIPVHVINSSATVLAPEFGKASVVPVPLTGTVTGQYNGVQLLQRRPSRYKALIYIGSLPSTGSVALQNVALGASTIATSNLNSFPVVVTVAGGTVTQITINGVATGATSGSFLLQPGGLIAITYTVAPTLTTALPSGASLPSSGSASVVLSHDPAMFANPNNPQGYTVVSVPHIFQWENQEPLYAVALGAGPVNVSVIDQANAAKIAQWPESEQAIEDYEPQESGNEDVRTTANLY